MTVLIKKSDMKAAIARAEKMGFMDTITDEQMAARKDQERVYITERFFRSLDKSMADYKQKVAELATKLADPDQAAWALQWSLETFKAAAGIEVLNRVNRMVKDKTWAERERIINYLRDEISTSCTSMSRSSSATTNLIDEGKVCVANEIIRDARWSL
jgi:hypothetical protein